MGVCVFRICIICPIKQYGMICIEVINTFFKFIENFKIIIKKLYNNELKIKQGPPERRCVQQAAPT